MVFASVHKNLTDFHIKPQKGLIWYSELSKFSLELIFVDYSMLLTSVQLRIKAVFHEVVVASIKSLIYDDSSLDK